MSHNYYRKSITNDAINLRKTIAGKGRKVISILDKNHYESIYIHGSPYLLTEGCYVEKCFPDITGYRKLLVTLNHFYFFDFLNRTISDELDALMDSTDSGDHIFSYIHMMHIHGGVKNRSKYATDKAPEFRKNLIHFYWKKSTGLAKMTRIQLSF